MDLADTARSGPRMLTRRIRGTFLPDKRPRPPPERIIPGPHASPDNLGLTRRLSTGEWILSGVSRAGVDLEYVGSNPA